MNPLRRYGIETPREMIAFCACMALIAAGFAMVLRAQQFRAFVWSLFA